MDFSRHPGPLFFPHTLQAGRQRTHLPERMLRLCSRLLACRYIHHQAISFDDLSSLLCYWINCVVNVLDRTIGMGNPVVHRIAAWLRWRILNSLLDPSPIVSMDSRQERLGQRGSRGKRVEPKDPKSLLRPKELSRGHVPGPAAGAAQPLSHRAAVPVTFQYFPL